MVESGGQRRVVLLHALPFDSQMWLPVRRQLEKDGVSVVAPDLYRSGSTTAEWATAVLARVTEPPVVLVGCSVGGSCALEIAALAPEQITGMVLIGSKAERRPDPSAHREAIELLESGGRAVAWDRFWRPLFGSQVRPEIVADARAMFDRVRDRLGRSFTGSRHESVPGGRGVRRPIGGGRGGWSLSPTRIAARCRRDHHFPRLASMSDRTSGARSDRLIQRRPIRLLSHGLSTLVRW